MEEKLNDIPFILSTLYEELNSLRNKFSIVAKEKKTLLKELASKDRLLGLKDEEIKRLTGENLKLQKKLSSFELPVKNSHNSSIPGSKNPIASAQILRTRSLRGKSDLPTGGQPGHAGHTLEYCSHPDVIQTHVCEYCRHCGSSLSDIPYTEQGARQVIDLPAIVPVVTEHRIYSRECTCGHINKADFPVDVRSRISYGPRIQAFISYTNTVQIYKEFPEGLPKATLVTDRHSSYFCIPVKEHQICLAHLLRELNYLSELNKKQTWSQRFLELLRDAIHQRKTKKWENIPRQEFEQKLDELLNEPLWQYQKEFWGFRKALARKKDYIFKFLYDPDVPYDNNASESAIRIIKTKLKVCGCFRSEKGADTFMQLHSIVDTAKKNQISRYKTLLAIAKMPAEDHCTPKEQPE
ncbi:transposase [uncultured Bacteroides sp.]|uniref:IS66 family transposase n=1 Tax=uncultured Bacteroides sp. TaxID=162156 RepID=UPI002AA736F5|nr:transposase [uncultured Bacteroides sp.]